MLKPPQQAGSTVNRHSVPESAQPPRERGPVKPGCPWASVRSPEELARHDLVRRQTAWTESQPRPPRLQSPAWFESLHEGGLGGSSSRQFDFSFILGHLRLKR